MIQYKSQSKYFFKISYILFK